MKNKAQDIIAQKIVDAASYSVKNSVGKCWPLLVHEVEMPECVRKEFMDDIMNEGK